ncbi:uncharacterized protein LOC120261113 [Dioscorea cayenensis subsp. rotundata]|uniref:Uncharacterized protein LOC120261113 n=1 Tax=Dioscorea cayennensis subsp. rotundata TaxID=55577 RepID=A0AB40BDR8_DIOCR|nr:uncharacterized protein LOC120261113 [Dioscorea cayenensis subsp. rotundata]XP_039124753.1 uncharacterized protein LOC120261113 [Dioscorea cayenensis subsp. rotundata]XP_039124754.1 uncharacterized protein LOC120261113 [Dioscorea cayenensis subsp. rotundata]XP_039124755.1 uncharacterized protein LOC120261113 [Dioscorea cayenensis subsp. rotundata]XP_039124756.1 uncharacterized protein LOC120261113 [Dioscorea cayenensis subsp. rotundata]
MLEMILRLLFGLLFLLSVLSGLVHGKECTNGLPELASHSLRYRLGISKDEVWKADMLSHYHLTPSDDSAWMGLLPRRLLPGEEVQKEEFDWAMLYRKIKNPDGVNVRPEGENFLNEISLHDVRLDPDSIHGHAQQTNLEYLLMLDTDNLLWSFRKQAGLPTPGKPYGGWEAPDVELRGHFVGHFLSASAMMWASTHNDTLYQRMTSVVDALNSCQKKIGTGYLSAFPTELFDRVEALVYAWAPYYTIHKIMAGLLDQYTFAGNSKALPMAVWMADYFANRVKNVILKYSIERHWRLLNEETGGMNDVLYRLYSITGDQKHLILAHLFDKPCFLGMLAVKADSLSGFHTNTHVPVVIGAQHRYEITGDLLYREIGTLFLDVVNSSHTYATGGTSVSEFWSDPKRLADTLTTETEESCVTHNMLKVSRNLFRWTKEIAYADYYERALTNGVLSIQRGREPGVMLYLLSLEPGKSKKDNSHGWGTQFESFWCCYGTAIESFSKLGDSIYFEEKGDTPGLYIIQYIANSFNWKSGGVTLHQKIESVSSMDAALQVSLAISSNESSNQPSTLHLRIPRWTSVDGAKATLNDQDLSLPAPGNFLSVTRQWTSNDNLTLQFPIGVWTEAIKDDRPEYASVQAILFGPYLLAGLTDGDWNLGTGKAMSDWITPIPASYSSQLTTLSQELSRKTFVLSNSNKSLTMKDWPYDGTNDAVHATFRLIPDSKTSKDNATRPQYVMLEPFDLPGMVVVEQGPNNELSVDSPTNSSNSVFQMVAGLDGKPNTVSFESVKHPRCFISAGDTVKLLCQQGNIRRGMALQQSTSFVMNEGLKQYHPISFIAAGAARNFVLEPLLSLKDETYSVYFNIN